MVAALQSLGVRIEDVPADLDELDWAVTPRRLRGPADIDCGLAGTIMRFLPPVAVLADGPVRFDGDARARERPLGVLLDALRSLGAEIQDGGRQGLPFTIVGTGGFPGGVVTMDASASSQLVSGLLLAGARYDKGVTVHHDGKQLPSMPHIDMTVQALRGARIEVDDSESHTWRVAPGAPAGLDLAIEPDLSNAAPFLTAALVTGGEIRIPGWPAATTQAGDAVRDLLTRFGADCRLTAAGLIVRGTGRINGIDANLNDVGELTPVLTALAALADSPSQLRGVAHIRGHETDRLAALATELNALGADVTQTEDGLIIRPRPMRGGVFRTYADHRIAQAGAVLGLAVAGIEIQEIATTVKTLPDFPGMWHRMLSGGQA